MVIFGRNFKRTLTVFLISFLLSSALFSDKSDIDQKRKKAPSEILGEKISFSYDKADLKDILNEFAEIRGINLIHPDVEAITAKVTFNAGKEITIAEAWQFIVMMLEQAGFTLVQRNRNTYLIVANKKSLKETVPLFINVDYEQLPVSKERIRYVYFCKNIQVSKQKVELTTFLKNILTEDFPDKVIFDDNSNLIIFTASSEMIIEAMRFISLFDRSGPKDSVEIIHLDYGKASEIAQILNEMITSADKQKAAAIPGSARTRYFSEYTIVRDLDAQNKRKLNSLVVIGKSEDVLNIKNFIKKYLDLPQQSGKSFFHVVDLDWIQAQNLQKVLQSVTSGQGMTGAGQSTSSQSNLDLAFDPQIKVIAETKSQGNQNNQNQNQWNVNTQSYTQAITNTAQRGGNRVVIASPERDWKSLSEIIKKIDIPQKQIIFEALVVDLDLRFTRKLGSQLRTKGLCPSIFPKDMQAQAALLSNHVMSGSSNGCIDGKCSLVGDLSKLLGDPDSSLDYKETGAAPNFQGSTVFTFSGEGVANGVWAFFQLLSTHTSSKLLTRPVVVGCNGKQTTLTSSVQKQVESTANVTSNANTTNISQDDAPISISFMPIISSNDIINLQLDFSFDYWADVADLNGGSKTRRNIQTNLSAKSGDLIILGGLTKETILRSKRSIPFFDSIPIIGSFAATRSKETVKDQLFVLIKPTVIHPRKQGGMNSVTQYAANFVSNEIENYEDNFSNLKDPITRLFFDESKGVNNFKADAKLIELSDPIGTTVQNGRDFKPEGDSPIKSSFNIGWLTDTDEKGQLVPEDSKETSELQQRLQRIENPFSERLVL